MQQLNFQIEIIKDKTEITISASSDTYKCPQIPQNKERGFQSHTIKS